MVVFGLQYNFFQNPFLIIQCIVHCPLEYIWQPNSGCMSHGSSGFGMISTFYLSIFHSLPIVLHFSTILGNLGNQIQG
uniref:Zinc finger DHHC-type palmitoyltransferase 17 n=1 Tax=Rousettus aegyptiacus TaxID=9407 RepID=A0A7J8JRB5_ROUAE|nr:zinc finger DHHC-type palmitoyltransferase 17 [Rousettus aegyptiacus]